MTKVRPLPTVDRPIDTRVRPPGSKSETIRALAVAAMADGRSHLYEALHAEDPSAMSAALKGLGIEVLTDREPWTVEGREGRLEASQEPLDANESGLSARILLAMAGAAVGTSLIVGRGRLPQRPMGGIVDVLRSQGVEVSGDHLPIEVTGRGQLKGGHMRVDCSKSSQFATAAMLMAPVMAEPATIELEGLSGSAGYLEVTESTMVRFGAEISRTVTGYEIANTGYVATDVIIEPDASASVYPMGIAAVTGGRVVIEGLGRESRQPDLMVASVLGAMGCAVESGQTSVTVDARDIELQGIDVDLSAAPDGALAVAVVCLFADGASRISGLRSLRHKESDRLSALCTEIGRIGGDADVEEDSLIIRPRPLVGSNMESHGDHRIAMAMAIAGIRLLGSGMRDPDAVSKTWPGFWDWLDELVAT